MDSLWTFGATPLSVYETQQWDSSISPLNKGDSTRSPQGVHMDLYITLVIILRLVHVDSLWTPETKGGVNVDSTWSPTKCVAQCKALESTRNRY